MTLLNQIRNIRECTEGRVAVCEHSDVYTYGDLDDLSDHIADQIKHATDKRCRVVAVCLTNSAKALFTMIGAWKVGAAYVPLDPNYPLERKRAIIQDSQADIIVTAQDGGFEEEGRPILNIASHWPLSVDVRDKTKWFSPKDSDCAYILYTSGSTGRPKGVKISHGNLAYYIQSACQLYSINADTVAIAQLSLAFDASVTALWAPLVSGGSVYVVPASSGTQGLISELRSGTRPNFLKMTPSQLRLLTSQLSSSEISCLSGCLVVGGEQLYYEDVSTLRSLAPSLRIFNEYGPTEATVGCIVHEIAAHDPDSGPVPIGRPFRGVGATLLDRTDHPLVGCGEGELVISGPGIGLGYTDQAAASRFEESPEGNTYRTGDFVQRTPEGVMTFLGRQDGQLKYLGHRIEAGEIEALAMTVGGISAAAAFLANDELCLAYCSHLDHADEQVQQVMKHHLPAAMCPTKFVQLNEIPTNSHGKADIRSLKALVESEHNSIAGTNPLQDVSDHLSKLWAEVLHAPDLNEKSHFFSLGGHSVLALVLVERCNKEFQIELPMNAVFLAPTFADFKRLVQNQCLSPKVS